jgi:hypothetical protein
MKIEFVEDINLALCKNLEGRAAGRRHFKSGEIYEVEFLGEDSDRETIDIEFAHGSFAMSVPRFAVNLET